MAKGKKRLRKATPTNNIDGEGRKDPAEVSCSLCEISIDDNKEIQCKTCHSYFHHICANVSDDVFEVLHPILPSVSWVCQECMDIISVKRKSIRTEIQSLTDAVHKLKEGYDDLKQKMADLGGGQLSGSTVADVDGALSTRPPPNTSNISQVVSQTVKDQLRRKKNIIVSGLPESNDESDASLLRSLCEQHLDCKPWIDETKCKRIGKTTENVPRRLLVTLSSDQTVTELLDAAKRNLRRADPLSPVSKIYFNPDLSPEEAKQAYLKRQERRLKVARQQQQQQEQSVSGSSMSLNPLVQPFPVAVC